MNSRARAEGDRGLPAGVPEARPQLDNDGLFAKAMKGRPVVLGYYLSNERGSRRIASIPGTGAAEGHVLGRNIYFTSWVGYGGNLPEFQKSAANAGHFNPFTDPDGIVRRVPMLAELDGAYYEALSLAVVRTLLGFPKVEPGYTEGGVMQGGYSGLEWLRTGPLTIPVDESVSALVPFRGDRYSFPYISISDVLADRVQPAQLKGRIALVGASASGLLDLRATPVNSVYAGVEVHANMIAGILDRKIPQKPPVHAGRGGDADRRHRPAARDPDPDAVGRLGDAVFLHRARGGLGAEHPRVDAGAHRAAARDLAADDPVALRDEHGVRLLRRVAFQAPVHRALRPVRAARAGRPDGAGPGEVQHGGQGGDADGACFPTCADSPASRRAFRPRT
jgi:hypothetical protein